MDKVAFITMDVESYFDTSCVQKKLPVKDQNKEFSCAKELLNFQSLLKKYNCRGTFYLTGTFIQEILPYTKQLKSEGHEISLHCYKHVSPLTQTVDDFRNDILESIKLIKENFDEKPAGFRAPCFGIDDERLSVIKENNFVYDSSFMDTNFSIYNGEINTDSYKKINDSILEKNGFYELLPSVTSFFGKKYPVSGGAYLRMPTFFFVKLLLIPYLKKSDSYVFYVHPFEISKDKLPLPKSFHLGEVLFVNRGRKQYLRRIEKILKLLVKYGYRFTTPVEFLDNLKNEKADSDGR